MSSILGIIGCKNEVEVIAGAIENLRTLGVNQIAVVDFFSTDGTPEVLRAFENDETCFVTQIDQPDESALSLANPKARAVLERFDCEWVLFSDADERWATLDDQPILALAEASGADIVLVNRLNALPPRGAPLQPGATLPPELTLANNGALLEEAGEAGAGPAAWLLSAQSPRLVFKRAAAAGGAGAGAHTLRRGGAIAQPKVAIGEGVLVAHFPFTTRTRFRRKVESVSEALEKIGALYGPMAAGHWRRWAGLRARGELDAEYAAQAFHPEQLAALLDRGEALSLREALARGKDADQFTTHRTRAQQLREVALADQAVDAAREGLTRWPGDAGLRWTLTRALLDAQRLEEARREAEQLASTPQTAARGFLALAWIANRAGDAAAGEAHLRAALDADPRSVEALQSLAELLEGQSRYSEAEAIAARSVEASPTVGSYCALMRTLNAQGKCEEALAAAAACAARGGDTAALQLLIADAHRLARRPDLCEAALRQALRLAPANGGVARRLAMHLWKDGRPAEAAQALAPIVARPDAKAGTVAIYGRLLAALGRRDEAEAMAKKAETLDAKSKELATLRAELAGGGRKNVGTDGVDDRLRAMLVRFVEQGDLQANKTVKLQLARKLPIERALDRYRELWAGRASPQSALLPITPLREHFANIGIAPETVWPGGPVEARDSRIWGEPERRPITFNSREVYFGCLRDVTVTAHSSFLEAQNRLLGDFSSKDLSLGSLDGEIDPLIFKLEPNAESAWTCRLSGPAVEIDEAVHLSGMKSVDWGHWIAEFLFKLFILRRAGAGPGAPLLIDRCMPESHHQALAHFDTSGAPVIALDRIASVRVKRLWVCSAYDLMSHHPAAGYQFAAEHAQGAPPFVAALVAGLAPPPADPDLPKKLYLARKPGYTREITNESKVADALAARGFVKIFLEDHPFLRQRQLVWQATHIAGPAGSALMFAFIYGSPSLKTLDLHPPAIEDTPALSAIAEARGQEVLVLRGALSGEEAARAGNSRFSIDVDAMLDALAALGV